MYCKKNRWLAHFVVGVASLSPLNLFFSPKTVLIVILGTKITPASNHLKRYHSNLATRGLYICIYIKLPYLCGHIRHTVDGPSNPAPPPMLDVRTLVDVLRNGYIGMFSYQNWASLRIFIFHCCWERFLYPNPILVMVSYYPVEWSTKMQCNNL